MTLLKQFFHVVSKDTDLQKKLYTTANLSDVAFIAHELNFPITPSDVLKAHAASIK